MTTPHDPARVAEARAWVVRAARDLRAAEHEFHAVPPLLDDIVFHCQQAAEKALKGFLTWHERPFRRTHSLEELGEQCLTVVPAPRPGGAAHTVRVEVPVPWRDGRALSH